MADTLLALPVTGGTLNVDTTALQSALSLNNTVLEAAILAALSNSTFTPSAVVVTPTPVALTVIFAQNGKTPLPQDYSFGGKATLNDTSGSPQAPNTADVLFTVTAAWGGYQPSNNNGATSSLAGATHVRVDLKPTQANQTYNLGCMKGGDVALIGANGKNAVPLALPGIYGPAAVAGQWSTYLIPVADLFTDYSSGSPVVLTAIYKMMIQDSLGVAANEFYVDNFGGIIETGGASVPVTPVTPVTPASTPVAAFQSLAASVKANGKLLLGQHTQYFEGNTNDEGEAFTPVTPLFAQTGKLPAIIGVTANWFGSSTPATSSGGGQPDLDIVAQMITDWCSPAANSRKPLAGAGMVQINWGVPSPVDGKTGPAISSANLASVVTPGSSLYNTLKASTLALQAWLLSVVKTNPQALLMLRLFAEINGNYTWYGTQNSQTDVNNQIKMQQQCHDTLFGGAGAALRDNVLISYNGNNYGGKGPAAAWPGTAYADVAGYDMYSAAWTTSSPPVDPASYQAFAAFGVPLIHCEVGLSVQGSNEPTAYANNTVDNMLIPTYLRSQEPACIGYVQWNDNGQASSASMSITLQKNASQLMNEPWAVTLEDLPSGI